MCPKCGKETKQVDAYTIVCENGHISTIEQANERIKEIDKFFAGFYKIKNPHKG